MGVPKLEVEGWGPRGVGPRGWRGPGGVGPWRCGGPKGGGAGGVGAPERDHVYGSGTIITA